MIDLRKVHEQEVFELVGRRMITLAEVQPVLVAQGFVFEDDFAWLRRTDRVERWQTETLIDCHFLAQGRDVYPDESDFDALRFDVLVASLPQEQVVKALHLIFDMAVQIRLDVSHCSRAVCRVEIPALVTRWSEDILGETGDICGSESTAILISMEYDKRRT
jgi:hypothetical protein